MCVCVRAMRNHTHRSCNQYSRDFARDELGGERECSKPTLAHPDDQQPAYATRNPLNQSKTSVKQVIVYIPLCVSRTGRASLTACEQSREMAVGPNPAGDKQTVGK